MNSENIKKEKAVINDESLKSVTGGTAAPELPATTLANSEHNGMFSNPEIPKGPGGYESSFYNGKVVDPSYFIAKTENE